MTSKEIAERGINSESKKKIIEMFEALSSEEKDWILEQYPDHLLISEIDRRLRRLDLLKTGVEGLLDAYKNGNLFSRD